MKGSFFEKWPHSVRDHKMHRRNDPLKIQNFLTVKKDGNAYGRRRGGKEQERGVEGAKQTVQGESAYKTPPSLCSESKAL